MNIKNSDLIKIFISLLFCILLAATIISVKNSEKIQQEFIKTLQEENAKITTENDRQICELENQNQELKEMIYSIQQEKNNDENEIELIYKRIEIDESKFFKIPNCDTSFKAYMDYRTITDKNSNQFKLQEKCYTDENGLRKYGDYYCVAVGKYYSKNVGDRFKIIFDSDNEIAVIISDIKQNKDTDITNAYSPVIDDNGKFVSANVLEFIVDVEKMDSKIKRSGSVNGISFLNGNLVMIEKI